MHRRRDLRSWTLPAINAAIVTAALMASAIGMVTTAPGPSEIAVNDVEALLAEPADAYSVLVVDRDDRLLRPFLTGAGRWRLPADPDAIDPRYLAMLVAFEDRRFFDHHGVDPRAVARAAWQTVRHGRVVSGASTLTMQLARLADPAPGRTIAAKLREMARALHIEATLGKAQILRRYLDRAPFGGNLEGVRAASLAYFGKEPRRLTIAEAALLVAIPQSPTLRRPDRYPDRARAARDRVLDRMARRGVIDPETAAAAKREPVPTARRPVPRYAAHLAREVRIEQPDQTIHHLTIDLDLQRRVEILARDHATRTDERISAAIVVADHGTGEVMALAGSAGFLDHRRSGHVDMSRAVRSPGSALKPFIYGLAFETGRVHPQTLIEDRPTEFGAYAPTNFDKSYQGTVTVAEALRQSLNVPAVMLLEMAGPVRLRSRLEQAGMRLGLPADTPPSLAIGLGGVGVTLRDLVGVYTALPHRGEAIGLRYRRDRDAPDRRAVMEPGATEQVAAILAGVAGPELSSTHGIAYKTGTSYGYRDAWAVGFDGRHVVGVWLGRPDAGAVPGMTGYRTAAPLLFEVFTALRPDTEPFRANEELLARSDPLPAHLRLFRRAEDRLRAEGDQAPLRVVFPPDRAELALDRDRTGAPFPIALRAEGGTQPYVWLIDGVPIETPRRRRQTQFTPSGEGFVEATVIDGAGAAASVRFSLD